MQSNIISNIIQNTKNNKKRKTDFRLLLDRQKRKKSLKGNQNDRQNNEKDKKQTMIYLALNRELQIEQHEPYLKTGVNSGAPEE